jgi:hypothetical protein
MANFKHISIDGTSYDAVPAGSYVTGVKGSNESTYRTGNVNLSKTNVGLGNVPNVTTNNQTPTFSQASTRANIASGEKLSVLFGKIMKFFADLKTVAFTGAYSDLTGKPTIPTVNNGRLTIQHNGNDAGYFTANQSGNTTVNITDTPFNLLPTNSSKIRIYKDSNGHCVVNASDSLLTISAKGLSNIDQISASANYPTGNHYLSGTLSDGTGTKVYPCVIAIQTDGKIRLRQKDVTSDTIYLNVNGYIITY